MQLLCQSNTDGIGSSGLTMMEKTRTKSLWVLSTKNDSQGILVYPPSIGYQPRYWRRRPTFNGVEENLFDAPAGSAKNHPLFFIEGEFGILGSEFTRNRNSKFLFWPCRTSGVAGKTKNRVEPYAV